ncbi:MULTISPECIES: MucR family transcriptional regulator [Hyphomonas]|uniref:Ros/MucR family transcriptional regulator n=1 Tax=Hyphomonas adhaerens MHS-3 TaxID=1280949 RepID=A0A069E6W0_9PROT|nr:MucR family transcriptional regulator [Hyphomonas adhaerens]KCZ85797.1 Ros/MucR family transcriptional regulator [Hyphomonas adhaerens MHS-3]
MSDTNKGEQDQPGLVGYASKIVAAYVGNNTVASDDLPDLIRLVHDSLSAVAGSEADKPQLKPAVPVAKSISDNFLICLEDGKKFKSLKRHLRTSYDMSPEEYRAKWHLPSDYPMVAPGYSRQRSKLAKKMGLGRADK